MAVQVLQGKLCDILKYMVAILTLESNNNYEIISNVKVHGDQDAWVTHKDTYLTPGTT